MGHLLSYTTKKRSHVTLKMHQSTSWFSAKVSDWPIIVRYTPFRASRIYKHIVIWGNKNIVAEGYESHIYFEDKDPLSEPEQHTLLSSLYYCSKIQTVPDIPVCIV